MQLREKKKFGRVRSAIVFGVLSLHGDRFVAVDNARTVPYISRVSFPSGRPAPR